MVVFYGMVMLFTGLVAGFAIGAAVACTDDKKQEEEVTFDRNIKFYSDKTWNDTVIEVVGISKDESEVRYKFRKVKGSIIYGGQVQQMEVSTLLNVYVPDFTYPSESYYGSKT